LKAAYLSGEKKYEVREVPDPQTPLDGLLLDIKACGVCGSDIRRWIEGPTPGSETTIAGHEIAGVVSQVGPGLEGYQVGDRLAVAPDIHCGQCYYCQRGHFNLCNDLKLIGITPGCDGGFAEKMALSGNILKNGIVHRIPAGMSVKAAALAEPLSSVLACHATVETSIDDTVLVMGGGPIGCLHIVVAAALGARVYLSEPSPIRRKLALPFNPIAIFDPSAEDVAALIRRATDNIGVSIAICANPVAVTHNLAIELVRKRGKVVFFGGLPKSNPMSMVNGNRIHYDEIMVLGSFSYHPTMHELALDAIQRGLVPVDDLVTHTFTIEEIDQVFHTAASGEALKATVVLD
jgi:L-iditol 2-dehydrogenase